MEPESTGIVVIGPSVVVAIVVNTLLVVVVTVEVVAATFGTDEDVDVEDVSPEVVVVVEELGRRRLPK